MHCLDSMSSRSHDLVDCVPVNAPFQGRAPGHVLVTVFRNWHFTTGITDVKKVEGHLFIVTAECTYSEARPLKFWQTVRSPKGC